MAPQRSKLITGFLLLATLGASGGYLAVGFLDRPPAPSETPSAAPTDAVPQQAFVEPITAENGAPLPAPDALPPTFTDRLAQAFASGIAGDNPALQPGGLLQIDDRGIEEIAEGFANDPDLLSRIIAEDKLARSVVATPTTIENPSLDDYARYEKGLAEAIGGSSADRRFLDLLAGTPTPEAIGALELALRENALKIRGIPVPADFLAAHRATLQTLVSLTQLLGSAQGLATAKDPLFQYALFKAAEERTEAALVRLDDEIENIQTRFPLKEKTGFLAPRSGLLARLFGIPEARAYWLPIELTVPVDCAGILICIPELANEIATTKSTGSQFWRAVKNFAIKLAIQFVKDFLVHRLVKLAIEWIQGGGKPHFVGNWGAFIGGAASDALGNAIMRDFPQLCSSFGPLVTAALHPQNAAAPAARCTIGDIVQNIRTFATSFENGGWIAYGAALQPQNNFFGALISMKGVVDLESRAALKAAKLEAETGKGWKPTKICVKEGLVTSPFCPGCAPVLGCHEWSITTPAPTVGEAFDEAAEAPIHRIVNAKDMIALGAALLNALVTKLISLASASHNATINPGLANVSAVMATSTPDFSACNILPLAQQQQCIAAICQTTGWNLPPCPPTTDPPSEGICWNDPNCYLGPPTYWNDVRAAIQAAVSADTSGTIFSNDGFTERCNSGWPHVRIGQEAAYLNAVANQLRAMGYTVATDGVESVSPVKNNIQQTFDILSHTNGGHCPWVSGGSGGDGCICDPPHFPAS